MPSGIDVERPPDARAVARRYLRRERPLSGLVAALVVAVVVGTFLRTSLLPAVLVGGAAVVVLRAPVLRSRGTVRLRTAAGRDAVLEAFTGPTPPVLPLQWGIADGVAAGTGAGAATYRTSYLLGLRSVEMTVQARTERTAGGDDRVTLVVEANGRPWATYTATVSDEGDRTRVHVEYTSDRRFGLRRLPQQFVAGRYRDEALAAQGYTVVERDTRVGV